MPDVRDYLAVQRPGGPNLYIPLGAVNRSDESGIYLSLSQAGSVGPALADAAGALRSVPTG